MNERFRNRVFLPVVVPLGIVLGIAAVVAAFAFILLYNTRITAIVLAILMAAGILIAVSLAASRRSLDGARRAAVLTAGATPVVLGVLLALGVVGGLPEEELNINREPHTVIPEGAPVIAAENSQHFCSDVNGCEQASTVTLPAGQEITLVFENREEGVPHNWTMRPSEDSSEVIAATEDGAGPAELLAEIPAQEPGSYYFLCTIHPNMNGTVEVSEDAAEASVDGQAGGGSGG